MNKNSNESLETNDRVLTTAEAAEVLGINKRTLDNWRSRGQGPAYIRYNHRNIGYLRGDVHAFRMQHRVEPVA